MLPLKIIITLLVLVIFGIVVGSNLSVMMTVVVLNQPTVTLPIGVWLIIAVGLGILTSSAIQLLLFLQRRFLTKKIRQLQTRLQEQDEDIFTYTSSSTPEPVSTQKNEPTPPRNRFSFGRNRRQSTSNKSDSDFSSPPPPKPIDPNDNDWEEEPRSNRQLDWDDVEAPRQQTSRPTSEAPTYSTLYPAKRDKEEFRSPPNRESELTRTDEIYDADFRLIQPPYKQPPDEEELEYIEEDEYEYEEESPGAEDAIEPIFTNQSNRQSDLDEEDWGFDFDDEDVEVERAKSRHRKN